MSAPINWDAPNEGRRTPEERLRELRDQLKDLVDKLHIFAANERSLYFIARQTFEEVEHALSRLDIVMDWKDEP